MYEKFRLLTIKKVEPNLLCSKERGKEEEACRLSIFSRRLGIKTTPCFNLYETITEFKKRKIPSEFDIYVVIKYYYTYILCSYKILHKYK